MTPSHHPVPGDAGQGTRPAELPLTKRAAGVLRKQQYVQYLLQEYFLSEQELASLTDPRRSVRFSADLQRRVAEGLQTFVLEKSQRHVASKPLSLRHYKVPQNVLDLIEKRQVDINDWLNNHFPGWKEALITCNSPSAFLMTMLAALEEVAAEEVAALRLTEQQRIMLMLPPVYGQQQAKKQTDREESRML